MLACADIGMCRSCYECRTWPVPGVVCPDVAMLMLAWVDIGMCRSPSVLLGQYLKVLEDTVDKHPQSRNIRDIPYFLMGEDKVMLPHDPVSECLAGIVCNWLILYRL
jgi:hypothetical protein